MRHVRAALAATALAVTGVLGTALQADARGDGWEKVPDSEPYVTQDCGTTLTFTETVNKEWQRVTMDEDGTFHIQVSGAYKLTVTTEDGRSAMLNASGPGFHTALPDGTYIFNARGLNWFSLTPEEAAELGLPEDAILSGPITVRVNPDGSLTLVQAPSHIRTVCDLLH
jgi:hypothetical protein